MRPAVALLLAGALAGCADSQKLLGRFSSATCHDERETAVDCNQKTPEIVVSAVLAPRARPAAETGGASLPERALTRYIEAMQRFSKDADALRRNLAAAIEPPPEPQPFVDRSTFTGTLFVTAAYTGDYNPADRIDRLRITLTLVGAQVVSWTGARTLLVDIKPGQIQSVGKVSVSGGLDIKPPAPIPVSGNLMASTERTRTETLDVLQRVEDLTPSVEFPDTIVIARRGGFGVDLTGNAQMDVVLTPGDNAAQDATVFEVSGFDGKGGPEALTLTPKDVRLPRDRLKATITADYVVRHVLRGGGTAEEEDDQVEFLTRHTKPRDVTLALAPVESTWGLASNRLVGGRPQFLAVQTPEKAINLCFESKAQADRLLSYLGRLGSEPTRLGAYQVGLQRYLRLQRGFGTLIATPRCVAG